MESIIIIDIHRYFYLMLMSNIRCSWDNSGDKPINFNHNTKYLLAKAGSDSILLVLINSTTLIGLSSFQYFNGIQLFDPLLDKSFDLYPWVVFCNISSP